MGHESNRTASIASACLSACVTPNKLIKSVIAVKKTKTQFAICVSNDGCDDLGIWKLYRVLPDKKAAKGDFLRVVDESGEDYLYPAGWFVVVGLAPPAVKKLLAASA